MRKKWLISLIICLCICFLTGCTLAPYTNFNISDYEQVVIENNPIEIKEAPTKADIAEAYQEITVTIYIVTTGNNSTVVSFGSGFVVYSGGYIATNHHVISSYLDNPASYAIEVSALNDEESYPAKILWYDASLDSAIIHCSNYADMNSAKLLDRNVYADDEDMIRVTDELIAVGTPLDIELEGTVTTGTCSYVNRDQINLTMIGNVVYSYNWYHYLIQHNVSINHGNSGGPLIDLAGNVIGINTLGRDGTGEQGIFFAIPIYPIMKVLDKVVMNYEIYQAETTNVLFGIKGGDKFDGQYLSDLILNDEKFNDDGWLVKIITEDSWLSDKLQLDDIIKKITVGTVTYNINNTYDLVFARIDLYYTQTGTMTVIRNGEEHTFTFEYVEPEVEE